MKLLNVFTRKWAGFYVLDKSHGVSYWAERKGRFWFVTKYVKKDVVGVWKFPKLSDVKNFLGVA
jgi:hypothetical protein